MFIQIIGQFALINSPVPTLSRSDLRHVLDSDSLNKQLGCVLMQHHSDQSIRPIGYFSRTISDAEKKYDTTDQEFLVLVLQVLLLLPYIYGSHFEILTNHYSLKWLLDLSVPTIKLSRWIIKLQEYDYDFFISQ